MLVFLGIPLLAGFLTRTIGEKRKGRDWYEHELLPKLGPFALYGLLFTIVMLFALQGHTIADRPLDVVRIAVPLLIYFAITFTGGMVAGRRLGLGYPRTTTLAFTAAGNNFELAIAVAIAHLRRHLRPGPRRSRRTADRGAGPRRAGLRRAVGATVLSVPPTTRPDLQEMPS